MSLDQKIQGSKKYLLLWWLLGTLVMGALAFFALRFFWFLGLIVGASQPTQQVIMLLGSLALIGLPSLVAFVRFRGLSIRKSVYSFLGGLLLVGVVLAVINFYGQRNLREQFLKDHVPPFPGSTEYRISHFPGDGFDNEPSSTVEFRLDSADQKIPELLGFYREVLPRYGWQEHVYDLDGYMIGQWVMRDQGIIGPNSYFLYLTERSARSESYSIQVNF